MKTLVLTTTIFILLSCMIQPMQGRGVPRCQMDYQSCGRRPCCGNLKCTPVTEEDGGRTYTTSKCIP